jgi:hypothetical protein
MIEMNHDNKSAQSESRLGVAIALSMAMIFTSYAISVFNHHQQDAHVNAYTHSPRPVIVSYLA